MINTTLSLRELLPVATAVAGYLAGGLHTALANIRERRKALNALLYVLLQLRFEIRRSNPKQVLGALKTFISQRYGSDTALKLDDPALHEVLVAALGKAVEVDSKQISTRYFETVSDLAPFDPLLAYRLTGDQVVRYEGVVNRYYESLRQLPDLANDPHAPPTLAVMEQHTLDLAFEHAMEQLSSDVKRVARASWTFNWPSAIWALRRQDAVSLDTSEMEKHVDQLFTEMARIHPEFSLPQVRQMPPSAFVSK